MTPFAGRPARIRTLRPGLLTALAALLLGGASAAAPVRGGEAWRKVEAGRVTVVGTASDVKLVETAVTFRALLALLPDLAGGALGTSPPLVVAVVHDGRHLEGVGFPVRGPAGGRIVLAATSDEEARPDLLRGAVAALARRPRSPLPAWLATGLSEYLSTFSATEAKATLGRLVPEHVARLRGARLPAGRPALFAATAFEGTDAIPASELERIVGAKPRTWWAVWRPLHSL